MIHISDKLYITYAESVLSPTDENRVAEAFIQVIDRGLEAIAFPSYEMKRLEQVKNLEQLIEKFKDEQGLFDSCKTLISTGRTPKVVMYMDEVALIKFLSGWWKALFPAITEDGAFALYRLFGDSESIRNKTRANFISLSGKLEDASFHKVMRLYWGLEKKEFSKIFNEAKKFEVSAEHKDACSIEFHLMNYMLDKNYPTKSVLTEKIFNSYAKKFMKEIFYIKETIEEGLYALAGSEPTLSGNAIVNEVSILESVKKNSKLTFLLDDKLEESMAGYRHLEASYNLPKFAHNLLALDNQINKHLLNSFNSVEIDNPCLDYISKNRRAPEMESLIDAEIAGIGKSPFKLLDNLIKKNRLNPYIIPAMKTSIEQGLSIVTEFKF